MNTFDTHKTHQLQRLQATYNCTPGFYSSYGGPCQQCSTGKTSNGGAATDCYCSAGTSGSYFCFDCQNGQYSTTDNYTCTSCTDGKLSDPLHQSCITAEECSNIDGATQSANACYCSSSQVLSLDRQSCQASCGTNEVQFQLSHSKKYCGCNQGFIPDALNRSCIDPSQCNTSAGFEINNYRCVCSDSSKVPVLVGSDIQCQTQPSMKCNKNQYLKDGTCTACPADSTSPGGYVLECICREGYQMVNDQCQELQCNTTQYAYNNKCRDCPAGSKSAGGSGNTCECTPGFSFDVDKGQCVKCADKYTSDGGIGTTCKCAPGNENRSNYCSTCYSGVSPGGTASCSSCSGETKYLSPTLSECFSRNDCDDIADATVIDNFLSSSCTCNGKALNFKKDACVAPEGCGGNTTTLKHGTASGTSGTIDVLSCMCQSGYVLNAAKSGCELPSDCTVDRKMQLNGYSCECSESGATGIVQDGQVVCSTNVPPEPSCSENQYLSGETCVPCPANSHSQGGKVRQCDCDAGFAPMNNNVCTPLNCSTTQKVDGNTCARCPANSHSQGGQATTCECDVGYELTNERCTRIACQENQFLDQASNSCKQCPEHSTQRAGTYTTYYNCTCDGAYTPAATTTECTPLACTTTQYASEHQCKQCPDGSYSAGGMGTTCSCNPGYEFSSAYGPGVCRLCDSGKTSAGGLDAQCACAPGTQQSQGLYSHCSLCQANYISSSGQPCEQCPENTISDPLNEKCITEQECNAIQNANVTSLGCSCNGYPLNLRKDACVQKCGTNQTRVTLTSNQQGVYYCICSNGYVMDPTGNSCMLHSDCQTSNGLTIDNYKCVCQDSSQIPVQDPESGVFRCGNPVPPSPTGCNINQYLYEDACIACPANSHSNGGNVTSCDCDDDYQKVDNECKKITCQQNQYWIPNARVCMDCPDNSTSPGGTETQCDCGENKTFSNGQCIANNSSTQSPLLLAVVFIVLVVLLAAVSVTVYACRRAIKHASMSATRLLDQVQV